MGYRVIGPTPTEGRRLRKREGPSARTGTVDLSRDYGGGGEEVGVKRFGFLSVSGSKTMS